MNSNFLKLRSITFKTRVASEYKLLNLLKFNLNSKLFGHKTITVNAFKIEYRFLKLYQFNLNL